MRIRAIALIVFASVTVVGAQSAERPKFDVASVKLNNSREGVIRFAIQPGGRFVATDIPLKQLIRAAYTLQLYQIVEAPSWTESERFDITAVTGRELSETTTPSRWSCSRYLQSFHFRAHFEEREGHYALVRDNTERPGLDLTPAKGPCGSECGMRIGAGTLAARGVPLLQLAELLSQVTGRLVTDATGLAGDFDIDLRWTPESQPTANDAV